MISNRKLKETGDTILDDFCSAHDAKCTTSLINVKDERICYTKYSVVTKFMAVADHADYSFSTTSSFTMEKNLRGPIRIIFQC